MAQGLVDMRTNPGVSATTFSLSDSVEAVLPNGKYPRAFVPNVSGTLSFVAADDASGHTCSMVVVAGAEYHVAVKLFRSTGTTSVTAVCAYG